MQNEIGPITYGGGSTAITATMKLQEEQSSGGVVLPSLFADQFCQSSRYLIQQHQDMVNRNALCLTGLRKATLEADALILENASLRSVNRELKKQLSVLIRSSVQSDFDYNAMPFQMLNDLRNLSVGGDNEEEDQNRGSSWDDVFDESSTSVLGRVDLERSSLPKSISVRSFAHLKGSQVGGAGHGGKSHCAIPRSRSSGQLKNSKKVQLQARRREEEPIEMEMYSQGMVKTELCNKWRDTGLCPYGDQCQFAHGIEELRPVIRHPRYKTEVCRMVLAGDVCPYGHRCHFRHALTEKEKMMGCL